MKNKSAYSIKMVLAGSLLFSTLFTLASAEQSVKLNLTLADVGNDWVKAKGKYRVEVKRNQDQSTYSRREKLSLGLTLEQTDASALDNVKLLPTGRFSIDSEFIKQFPSLSDALSISGENHLSLPKEVPLTAKKAKALKPGTYYSAAVATAFDISAQTAQAAGINVASADLRYVISGDFRLEVYRLQNSNVLVRASSLKERTKSLHLGFGPRSYQLDVFGYDPLNNFIEKKFINVEFLGIDVFKNSKGKMFTVEYVYDLSTRDGRKAYEELMNPGSWRITDLAVINPLRKNASAQVRKVLVGKITHSELVSNRGTGEVERQSMSETDFTKKSSGLNINFLLGKNRRSKTYLEQDFSFKLDSSDKEFHHYKVASMIVERELSNRTNTNDRDELKDATIIFALDAQKEISRFDELNFRFRRLDQRLKEKEVADLSGQVRKMLPESLQREIDRIEGLFDLVVNRATNVEMNLVFSPDALAAMQKLTPAEISEVVNSFIADVSQSLDSQKYGKMEFTNQLESMARVSGDRDEDFDGNGLSDASEASYFNSNAKTITDALVFVLTRTKNKELIADQLKTFSRLQKRPMFQDLGSGIMSRLLERASVKSGIRLKDLIAFKVEVQADGRKELERKVGDYERPDYLAALIANQNRILNRDYDPSYFNE